MSPPRAVTSALLLRCRHMQRPLAAVLSLAEASSTCLWHRHQQPGFSLATTRSVTSHHSMRGHPHHISRSSVSRGGEANSLQQQHLFSNSSWRTSLTQHQQQQQQSFHTSCAQRSGQETAASSQHPPQQRQPPSNSSTPSSSSFSAAPDAFTRSLQSKTEQEVFSLLETARATKLAEAAKEAKSAAVTAHAGAAGAGGGDAAASSQAAVQAAEAEGEEEEDDTVDVINPETGEVYGPRGKEPTRYGDWEIKGRCTDFS